MLEFLWGTYPYTHLQMDFMILALVLSPVGAIMLTYKLDKIDPDLSSSKKMIHVVTLMVLIDTVYMMALYLFTAS